MVNTTKIIKAGFKGLSRASRFFNVQKDVELVVLPGDALQKFRARTLLDGLRRRLDN
jgi:hypothetical protein